MADYTQVDAVVLRYANYRESSRMVTFFTREKGRIPAAAKGALRPKSALRGATELMTRGNYTLSCGRGRYVITAAQVTRGHMQLSCDIEKLACAVYLRDFCEAVLTEEDPQPALFDLLCACLDALCAPESDYRSVRLYFEVRALDILGFQPELSSCAECGCDLPKEAWLSPAAGGLVCPACREKQGDAQPLLGGTLSVLRRMQGWDPARLAVLRGNDAIERNLQTAWRPYLSYYLERNFTLGDFLDKLSAFDANYPLNPPNEIK